MVGSAGPQSIPNRMAVRRMASEPSMSTFEGDTSVTLPPPFAVRLKEPCAVTFGSGLPTLVKELVPRLAAAVDGDPSTSTDQT